MSVYHKCPYCGIEEWGSVPFSKKSIVVECECGKNYILTSYDPLPDYDIAEHPGDLIEEDEK